MASQPSMQMVSLSSPTSNAAGRCASSAILWAHVQPWSRLHGGVGLYHRTSRSQNSDLVGLFRCCTGRPPTQQAQDHHCVASLAQLHPVAVWAVEDKVNVGGPDSNRPHGAKQRLAVLFQADRDVRRGASFETHDTRQARKTESHPQRTQPVSKGITSKSKKRLLLQVAGITAAFSRELNNGCCRYFQGWARSKLANWRTPSCRTSSRRSKRFAVSRSSCSPSPKCVG